MEKAMVVTLIITLLAGFSQEQTLLPPGPINKEVGGSVIFTTLPQTDVIKAIRWHFNDTPVIMYSSPGPPTVSPPYIGRVTLNYTTGTLELKALTMADSGQYSLTLTFESGIGTQDRTFLHMFERVLSVTITGPEGNINEHISATLTCEGNGTILSTVWMKEEEILAPSSSITFLEDNRTMVINPVMRSDRGNYQCTMSNPVSSSTASYSINVMYGPDVKILGAQNFEEGSDILLLCSPDSVPPATITWTVQGLPAGNEALYVTEKSRISDSGNYDCSCYNNATGITVTAVHVVTVRAVSSRLSPGVEAGITLGVVLFVVVISILLAYFLKKRKVKKPAKTGTNVPMTLQPNSHTSGYENPQAVLPEIQDQPIYENEESPPPKVRPAVPPNRKAKDSNPYCSAIS